MSITGKITGLACAATVIYGGFAAAAQPQISRNVPDWTAQERMVAPESGSSRAGKWDHDNSPLAIEPMACLSSDYPCSEVVISASAQLFKTEVGTNWIGQTICDEPCSFMALFPSLDELGKFNNTKLQPTIDATPSLRHKVSEIIDRTRKGSTAKFKRFKGGYLLLTTASSSKGLQGSSIKRLWGDEVSEYPLDAGGRGDPVKQALARGDAHDDFKALWTSTPKELPNCRITDMYEAGDRRKYYAVCPHCDYAQVLLFENMQKPKRKGGRAYFHCAANGCEIDEIHKAQMLGAGHYWIKTYPSEDTANPAPPDYFHISEMDKWRARSSEGRNPSFWAWQAYSKLKGWTKIWSEYEKAMRDVQTGKDPDAFKVFTQQKLGLAYDATNEAPDYQKLFEARGRHVKRGIIPAWACETILTADIQGDRIEWDAFAIGPCLSLGRFDWGVIEIDPLEDEAWIQLAEIIGRRWPGEATIDLGFDIVGIDSGGKKGVTERVYRFCRNRHNVLALKGSGDPDGIPLNKGKRQKLRTASGIVSCDLWLVGGWGLKSTIYTMLENSLLSQTERIGNGLYNPADATLEDFKQYVSEVFRKPKSLRSGAKGWWERLAGQANERLDLAVYARALAWYLGCDRRTPAEWQDLFQKRLKRPEDQLPLFALNELPPPPEVKTAENPGGERKSLLSGRTKL